MDVEVLKKLCSKAAILWGKKNKKKKKKVISVPKKNTAKLNVEYLHVNQNLGAFALPKRSVSINDLLTQYTY